MSRRCIAWPHQLRGVSPATPKLGAFKLDQDQDRAPNTSMIRQLVHEFNISSETNNVIMSIYHFSLHRFPEGSAFKQVYRNLFCNLSVCLDLEAVSCRSSKRPSTSIQRLASWTCAHQEKQTKNKPPIATGQLEGIVSPVFHHASVLPQNLCCFFLEWNETTRFWPLVGRFQSWGSEAPGPRSECWHGRPWDPKWSPWCAPNRLLHM